MTLSKTTEGDLLTEDEIIEVLCNKLEGITFTRNIFVEKINKGKVNYIFKVTDKENHQTVFIKQSTDIASVLNSPDFKGVKLNPKRNNIEVSAMHFVNKINSNFTPKIYMNDEQRSFFVMEEMKNFKDIRDLILNKTFPKSFSAKFSEIIMSIYANSEDYKKDFQEENPMKEILMALLFLLPYNKAYIEKNPYINDKIFYLKKLSDDLLKVKLAELNHIINNTPQTLLHGDLHLGSICNKDMNYKLYDFEFAFIGPLGYDVGKVLAHLILGWSFFVNTGTCDNSILKEIGLYFETFIEKYTNANQFSMVTLQEFKNHVLMFCGLELISRVTGPLQLEYILGIKDPIIQERTQKYIFELAIELIKTPEQNEKGDHLVKLLSGFKNV